jgi:hypothetical protein
MIPAAVVVVLFAAQDASDPSARLLASTAEGALAPGTFVVLRDGGERPTDDDALGAEKSLRADATALVTWADADHLTARIRLHERDRSRWVNRQIVFRSGDAPNERARAIGFALATMVQGTQLDSSDRAPSTPGEETVPARPAPSQRLELAMLGAVGAGIGGHATGFGAMLDGRWRVASTLWLRAGGSVRFGSEPEAGAMSRALKLDAGFAWHPIELGRVVLGPRFDMGAVLHRLARPTEGGPESTAERWIPVATLEAEVRWPVTSALVVGAAAGFEAALGASRVLLDGAPVATIPPLRTVAELGIGLRF